MFGEVVTFNKESNEGKILGKDKQFYEFHIGEWLSSQIISKGQKVSFDVEESEAQNIRAGEENTFHLRIKFRRVEGI
jgi:cold shock CspA family protein